MVADARQRLRLLEVHARPMLLLGRGDAQCWEARTGHRKLSASDNNGLNNGLDWEFA